MRIGILSDTHCLCDEKVAEYLRECDEIWHAGDIGDVATLQWLNNIGPAVRAVSGNIDNATVRRMVPERQVFNCAGAKIMITHIGGYPGKYAPGIMPTLRREQPDIFVAGHSHILRVMFDKTLNILHINPGAAGHHGWQKVRTIVRLSIDNGKPHDLEVIELSPCALH